MVKKLLTILLVLIFSTSNGEFFNKNLEELNSHTVFINNVEKYLKNSDENVSSECKTALKAYIRDLILGKDWARKMLDSGGKIPAGLMAGNIVDLGFFDECLNIEGISSSKMIINGKYCIGTIPMETILQYVSIPKLKNIRSLETIIIDPEPRMLSTPHGELGIHLATCLPHACSSDDIQHLYSNIFKPLTANMTFKKELCQTKASQPKFDGGSIATLSFLGVILGLIILSTAYDVAIYYLEKEPAHQILIAFSVFTNCKKIMKTSTNPGQINCLHGIRVISTMWVILGHRYVFQFQFPLRNFFELINFTNDKGNMFILGETVVVDTFFLISGLVLVYVYMNSVQKGVKFNIISFYLHRYLRLTPVVAVTVLIQATLVRQFGSGPLWPTTVDYKLINSCENYWWRALLYIQNFFQPEDMCVPQSWYLSVDMQLFFLSPLLLIPLKIWPKFTLIATGILTACSILAAFLTTWFLKLGRNLDVILDEERNRQNMKYLYLATWTRASPWFLGFILGYFVFKVKQRKTKFIINKFAVLILWVAAMAILFTCLFSGHDAYIGEYKVVEASFFAALVRPSWAIAVGWIIFACVTGNGGPVDWFLSLPIFQILSKLTFTMYMVHYAIIYMIIAQMRSPATFSNSHEMYVFWGDFACTTVVALIFTLAFESPLITVENLLLRRDKNKKRIEEPTTIIQAETKDTVVA